jgi:predicted extracellular nuclease
MLDLAVFAGDWLEMSTSLIFSEYVEGSGYNKAVEIYNVSSAEVDLTACEVRAYHNGSLTAGHVIVLGQAILAPGEVFVLCHPDMSRDGYCDQASGGLLFNGNDSVEIVCAGAVQDVIGQIGDNPTYGWGDGEIVTYNRTLRRSCPVTEGDTDGSDPFDPSLEWESFEQDSLDGLGIHCP